MRRRWLLVSLALAVMGAVTAYAQPRHALPSCDERNAGLMALVGDLRAQRNDQEWIAHGWKARADALQAALDKASAPKPEAPPK